MSSPTDGLVRVAFPYAKSITQYDPARIHFAPEYIVLENIFSPLVEINKDGRLEPGIAQTFEWLGDEAHLKIRNGLKTIDGRSITAEDAAYSLKRALVVEKTTHGNLRSILCPNSKFEKMDDSCASIRVEGNVLILKPESRRAFLFPMLSNIDFAVIPKGSINPSTLEITDYRNTSGPFYVEKDDAGGKLRLKANPAHYHYDAKLPQEIQFVPTDPANPNSSIEAFKNGEVDHLTTVDQARIEDVIQYSRSDSSAALHSTMNVRTIVLTFTKRGQKRFSAEQRLSIGKAARNSLGAFLSKIDGYESTDQLYPVFGEARLHDDEKTTYRGLLEKTKAATSGKGIRVSVIRLGKIDQLRSAIEAALPGIVLFEGKSIPNITDYSAHPEEEPDILLSGPDMGFLEDIGLISYGFMAGYFAPLKEGDDAWLKKYSEIADKGARLNELRKLHYSALMSGVSTPLASLPYVALARKPWKMNLSTFLANNPLWAFRQK